MIFPESRSRRLRKNDAMRQMVAETRVHPSDFVYPLLVSEIVSEPTPVESMPGIFNWPIGKVAAEAKRVFELGIPAVILFGTPSNKDATGSSSLAADGIVQRAVKEIKNVVPELLVITDVCLCSYTDHGHCGLINEGRIDNDSTLNILAQQAISHASAGADMIAPSDMMDGRVAAIREALDVQSFSDTPIMSYSAKYASAMYWPFREAAGSAPQFGDRKTYQMDMPNGREALKEMAQDIEEGADIVMVKPALAYLDIIAKAKEMFHVPIATYNVSGEYAMVKLSAATGQVDEKQLTMEILTSIKRAGADIIISYHAPDVAEWLR